MEYVKNFYSHVTADNVIFMMKVFVTGTIAALIVELIFVRSKSTLGKIYHRNIGLDLKKDFLIWTAEVFMIWPIFGRLFTLAVGVLIATKLNDICHAITPLKIIPLIPSVVLQVAVALLIGDFVLYWLHRIFHRYPALWQLHKFHHSTREMTVFSGQRDNPVVGQLWIGLTGAPSALLGSPSFIPLWVIFLNIFHNQIIHSKITSDWGWFGRWIIISPQAHLVHHSIEKVHHNKNFGFLSPIWDHIFGTYYNGESKAVSLGINEPDNNLMPWQQIWRDTTKSYHILWQTEAIALLRTAVYKFWRWL